MTRRTDAERRTHRAGCLCWMEVCAVIVAVAMSKGWSGVLGAEMGSGVLLAMREKGRCCCERLAVVDVQAAGAGVDTR